MERAAYHLNCIPDIGIQTHSIEQPYQVSERPLYPSWVRRRYHDVIRVEEGTLVPFLLSAPILLTRSLYNHLDPVPHYRIHHNSEDGG